MHITRVQILRKLVFAIVVFIGVVMFAFSNSSLKSDRTHEIIEWSGILAIVICILGRTWASLYIGGRKNLQLITAGPFSVARNPLYSFSILGAAGAGAQLGSTSAALIFAVLAWVLFYLVVQREERLLSERFGADYAAYKAVVPRFLPDPRLWRDVQTLVVQPRTVLRTFADAALFLVAVPLARIFEQMQDMGVLPVLLRLP
jgi:protein-S-isoprenylcysteine O-methyltransferase Ste14